jgi:hypothetical protein
VGKEWLRLLKTLKYLSNKSHGGGHYYRQLSPQALDAFLAPFQKLSRFARRTCSRSTPARRSCDAVLLWRDSILCEIYCRSGIGAGVPYQRPGPPGDWFNTVHMH